MKLQWWEDSGWPNEERANHRGVCYHVYRHDDERQFWLMAMGGSICRHLSRHRTRKAAKALAEAMAEALS